jgi:hypothetical protein
VFDFVHRDPKTYKPKSSAADTDPIGHSLTLGKYVIPLTGGASHNTRQGDAFWQVLDAHRVPSAVYRMPANFPPVASKSTTLSGMGTPDLMMGYGTYQVYTERPIGDYLSGGILHVVTFREGGRAQSVLNGPDNTYLKTPQATTVPITIFRDEQNPLVKVELADSTVLLKEGEWSDWVPVTFEMIPHLGSARGVCRMYLKRCRPDLVLYVSPINIDPLDPATPISTPDDACEDVAMAIGRYYTKGMPEETKALQDGVFDDEDFVRQGNLVIEESKKMLAHALDHYQSGLLFFYFSSIDLNCHMMWRHCDPSHPAHDPKLAKRYASRIEDLYVEMDHIVGEVRRRLPPDATLIIMSDHGFASFGREMNLNTWLARQGYLVLKDGADPTDAVVADTADWKRSKAYSVGFNGIYLNVAGREANGIVSQAERHALADEIRTKLLAERDPKTGERFIPSVNLANRDLPRRPRQRRAGHPGGVRPRIRRLGRILPRPAVREHPRGSQQRLERQPSDGGRSGAGDPALQSQDREAGSGPAGHHGDDLEALRHRQGAEDDGTIGPRAEHVRPM